MKPKVAFFDFASCEGCQLAILNCEEIFLDLLELIDIVEFREAMTGKAPRYDIAFVEGSIHREEDAERLREIRARADILIALGACADMGNVQARSNFLAPSQSYAAVYGEQDRDRVQTDPTHWPLWAHTRVRALSEVVPVDYTLRGCPVVASEFLDFVRKLAAGAVPAVPTNPVCVECKMRENECVFARGETCMGPVTWGGCHAICITNGYRCDGCRGLLPGANLEAHKALLESAGLGAEAVQSRYRMFCSRSEQQREVSR